MDSAASSGRTVIGLLIGMSVSGISGALVLHHIIEPLIAGSAYAAIGFLPTIWPAHVLLGVVAGLVVVRAVAPSPKYVDRPVLAITCRSEEHTSELQHLCISYAVFCLKKKK